MPLDWNDIKVIQTEAQILRIKLQGLDASLQSLKRVLVDVRTEQIKTNVLLETIAENTHRSILGRDYQVFTSGDD
jgi:hypothetical protein